MSCPEGQVEKTRYGRTYCVGQYVRNADSLTPEEREEKYGASSIEENTKKSAINAADITNKNVREGMLEGRKRAEELYGMDSKAIGESTQDIISQYRARLDDTTQSKQASNTARREARAEKGQNLTGGESAQLSRFAQQDQQKYKDSALDAYRSLMGNVAANTGSLEMGFANLGTTSSIFANNSLKA